MFHKLLKEFRLQAGMSQVQLAKVVRMNPSHLNRVERGLRRPPRREKVLFLADALGLDEEEKKSLVLEAGYSPPEQPKENEHKGERGYTAMLPEDGLARLEEDEETAVLPDLIREVLRDEAITPSQRREIAKQIRSFVLWLRDSVRKPQPRKSGSSNMRPTKKTSS